jgi:transposase
MGIVMDIKSLAAEGLKNTHIANRLGVDRGTVAKYLALESVPPRRTRKAPSLKIDPFGNHLKARLAKYPELTAERLFREIVELGYSGSRRTVRRFVASVRPHHERVSKPIETLP